MFQVWVVLYVFHGLSDSFGYLCFRTPYSHPGIVCIFIGCLCFGCQLFFRLLMEGVSI